MNQLNARNHRTSHHFKMEQSSKLHRNLQYENRPIAVYRALIEVLGSVKAAVLLSQMIYWTRVGADIEANDGWFRKTIAEFTDETGISLYEQETARRALKNLNIIETKSTLVDGITVSWVRVNLNGLSQVMAQTVEISMTSLSVADVRQETISFKSYFSAKVPYHTALAKIAGGVNAGLMLSCYVRSLHLGYNQRFNGYVTRGREVWLKETGLSFKEQLNARRMLIERGYITERNLTLSRHIDTSINLEKCFEDLTVLAVKTASKTSYEKRASLCVEKGFSATGKRAHIELAKGFIPISANGSYATGERVHKQLAKGIIHNKEQITVTEYITDHNNRSAAKAEPEKANAPSPEHRNVVVDLNSTENPSQTHSSLSDFVWPRSLAGDERVIGQLMLAGLENNTAQTVLDEMAGRSNVKNPLGYLRTLVSMVRNNSFIPEKAHKVKAARQQSDLRSNEAKAMQVQLPADESSMTDEERKEVREKNIKRLQNLRDMVTGKVPVKTA